MQNNGACVIVDDRYVSSWPIIRPSVPTRAESIMHGVSKGKRSARGAEALAVLNDRSTVAFDMAYGSMYCIKGPKAMYATPTE